ncbi:MAG: uroporphyrinogen decarboxylase family protein [Victivallaceae bacterium]|nr:uroporphyrinogen decarboxylase family protein [Victivallaceae bacterium]
MEHLERVLNVFGHKTPDRTPCFEYCLYSRDITAAALGRPCALLHWDECVREQGWQGAVRQLAVDYLDIAEFFGHDLIYVISNPPSVEAPRNEAAAETSPDDPVAEVDRRNRERRQSAGAVNKEQFLIYELLREEMERRKVQFPIIAPAYKHGIWTDCELMQTILLAPEVAREHFALATREAELLVETYSGLDIGFIGIGGDFAGNAPLISPACYREFIAPELKKLSDEIHRRGGFVINASDGNLWNAIDAFLINSGVDGYLEIDLFAGMELKRLKEGYGDRITFLGNMDCGNTLSFASPAEIEQATVKCLEEGLGNGGHVFTASNAITDSVPPINYLAMVNAYRKYWNLPRIAL